MMSHARPGSNVLSLPPVTAMPPTLRLTTPQPDAWHELAPVRPTWLPRIPAESPAAEGPTPHRRRAKILPAILVTVFLAMAAMSAVALHDGVFPSFDTILGRDTPTSGAITTPGEDGKTNAELVQRFERASSAAWAEKTIALTITTGARSEAKSQELVNEKVNEVGERVAMTLLPPAAKDTHVKGLAIDVQPADGAAWLAANGAKYGLCQVYENDASHFEPLTAPGGDCPPLHKDYSSLWTS